MTSNMGSHLIQENFENVKDEEVFAVTETTKVQVMELLRKQIRPEFLNRIDEIIMFKPLSQKEVNQIVVLQLGGLQKTLEEAEIRMEYTPEAVQYLGEIGFEPQYGARPLKRLIQKEIVNKLSKMILANQIDKSKSVIIDAFESGIVIRNGA